MSGPNPETFLIDRHSLYELCVQSPAELVPVLRVLGGAGAQTLGEDFCGTAAVSVEWLRQVPGGRAIAVDHDREVVERMPPAPGLEVVVGDVIEATEAGKHRVDVLYVGNFSIGEWHERSDLLRYLRHALGRLHSNGVLVCDLYGGESSSLTGAVDRDCPLPDGRVVRYTWEQREANPLTGRVVNALHFDVRRGDRVELRLGEAFVYDWRLWGVPELRDAMDEAGFSTTAVYHKTPDAIDDAGQVYVTPIEDPSELDDSFDVLVVARKGA